MTEEEIEEIIEKFDTDRAFLVSTAFLDRGFDSLSAP